MKETVTACVTLYNEGELIRRCLESLKDVVDEILVVHDGPCKNNTVDIAREYTKNVFVRERKGLCEFHQAFMYKKAKSSWLLKLDSDEFLSEGIRKNLRKLIEKKDVAGYTFRWLIWDGKKYITKNFPRKLHLYRKDKIVYLGFPNWGEPKVNGKVVASPFQVEHRPPHHGDPAIWSTFKKRDLNWITFIQAQNHFREVEDFENYNYTSDKMPLRIRIRRNFPILSAPFFSVFAFLINFKNKIGLKENPKRVLKRASLHFVKYLYYGYLVYKVKQDRNFKPKDNLLFD